MRSSCRSARAAWGVVYRDMTPDGQRFLINTFAGKITALPITLVVNALRNP